MRETDSYKSSETVLADAFTEAKQIFENVLCENEKDKAWISSRASIKDVTQAVEDARDAHHARRNTKAWKWLVQFSSRVQNYSSVLDVMGQHHPEYATFAWGAMKVLLVVRISMLFLKLFSELTMTGCCKP
jgi:hypothetical protein